jgi:hypothetical protein
LDPGEAEEVETRLRTRMDAAGLRWVLEQVDETLQEGVVEVVDKPGRGALGKVEELARGSLNRRRSERTRMYTPTERVALLLDAARRAVVETAELENQLFTTLEEVAGTREAEFASEPDDVQATFTLSAVDRPAETAKLSEAMSELRGDIEA